MSQSFKVFPRNRLSFMNYSLTVVFCCFMVFVNLVVTLLMIFHPREFFSFIFSKYIKHL